MSREAGQVEGYLSTVARIEPEISLIDRDAALTSIAVSLKRIADVLEGDGLRTAIYNGIVEGLWAARPK